MSILLAAAIATGAVGLTAACSHQTAAQKAEQEAAERTAAYTELLSTKKLTRDWGQHSGIGNQAATVPAVFDQNGGEVYRIALGHNDRNCYAVAELVAKQFPDNPVVTESSPGPEMVSKWTYRVVYIIQGSTPQVPQLAPPSYAVLASDLSRSLALGVSRDDLQALVAKAADDPNDPDHAKLKNCTKK